MTNTRVAKINIHIAAILAFAMLFCLNCKDTQRTEKQEETEPLEVPVIKSTQDYREWIAQSGEILTVKKKMQDLTFNCRLIPSDYAALQYAGKEQIENAALEEYQELLYFDLAIETNTIANPLLFASESHPAHSDKIHYYSLDFQHDIKAVINNDTISCELFNFERDNLIRNYLLFHLGFPKPKGKTIKEITLIVDDGCFHTGKHKFYYPKEKLSDIPKLIIQ